MFAATVAATMGLALGLVGAAFTLLNAYLVRPVNLPNPRALYILSWDTETTRDERFGLADYQALAPEAGGLAGAAATLDVAVMQDAVSTRGLRLASAAAVLDFGARPFVVGATTVFVATTVAALLPLLGTTRIDPAQALRTE